MSEIELAKHELELLKERERALEEKLGFLDNQEEYKQNSNLQSDGNENQQYMHKNGDLLIFDNNFQKDIMMNGDLQESLVDDLTNEEIDESEMVNQTNHHNFRDLIYESETNENLMDTTIEDEKLDELEKLRITDNSELEEVDGDMQEDILSRTPSPKDHRNDIFRDIYEAKSRENSLKIERGSFVPSETSTDETESIIREVEDSREKIVREIEEEKLRELELQAKNRELGLLINESSDDFEKTQLKENIETRQKITMEINELKQRENELRITQQNADNRREENIINVRNTHADPRQRIKQEISIQEQREAELKKMEQNISHQDNIPIYREPFNDNDIYEKQYGDSRGKILLEMEELKKRENELRERMVQQMQKKRKELHHNQQKHKEYERNMKLQKEREKYEKEEELQKQREEQGMLKKRLMSDARNRIKEEILELQQREEELQRRYAQIQRRKLEVNNFLLNSETLFNLNDISADEMAKSSKFGSRENLDETEKHSKVKNIHQQNNKLNTKLATESIPNNVSSENLNETTLSYTNLLQKSLQQQSGKKAKKMVLRRKSNSSKVLLSTDTKKESSQGNSEEVSHVHPLAKQWESIAEDKLYKQMLIEQEVQNKRDERIRIAEERAIQQRQMREQQRLEELERERIIQERAILKLKQKGLNDLWSAKIPLVTIDNNPDENDLHLLRSPILLQDNKLNAEVTPTPITLSKTIMKWERRIKRNLENNRNRTNASHK